MSRFDELSDPKKDAVVARAKATTDKLKQPGDATSRRRPQVALDRGETVDWTVDHRARQIANDPAELTQVLGEAGLPTSRQVHNPNRKYARGGYVDAVSAPDTSELRSR